MTDYIVFPGVDGDNVFAPEIRQAIADSPELHAVFAPATGSTEYMASASAIALLASKLNISEKGIALGLAALDANAKLLEANMPDRLSADSLRASVVTKFKPRTFYPINAAVVNPDGDVVTAKAAFTSDDVYNPGNWNVKKVDGGSP